MHAWPWRLPGPARAAVNWVACSSSDCVAAFDSIDRATSSSAGFAASIARCSEMACRRTDERYASIVAARAPMP
ncbi:hypothetical protein CJO96_21485 (plasmid) [Ralstonia solanacearum]|nr:hypothetical protein CJO84_20525 [Ralstonia solanacearum]AXW40895.1 hypothetical protein CJO89_22175 [Ralstonia solanacearum]AXW73690.1 hypothetical protein CJO96_21485 [Ralstonia solanacearum]